MSTRCSVYHEEDGIHIFQDLMDDDLQHAGSLFLEYAEGAFEVTIPLSTRVSRIIRLGLKAEAADALRYKPKEKP